MHNRLNFSVPGIDSLDSIQLLNSVLQQIIILSHELKQE